MTKIILSLTVTGMFFRKRPTDVQAPKAASLNCFPISFILGLTVEKFVQVHIMWCETRHMFETICSFAC